MPADRTLRPGLKVQVHDNGHGVADFQKLLSLHESGWDAATHDEEQPFGIGFSKCLYSATRCVVTLEPGRTAIVDIAGEQA